MPLFTYHALQGGGVGQPIDGTITADSAQAAAALLRTQGLYVVTLEATSITPASQDGWQASWRIPFDRVPLVALALATRQWATLLSAGFPLNDALGALATQTEHPTMRRTIAAVREQVQHGMTLVNALGQHHAIFPSLYIQLVRAGETSGSLAAVMTRLADYLEHQATLRGQISSALAYPILMTVISVLIIIGLLTYVVPNITQVFADMHQTLPLPTRALLLASDVILSWWWALLALLGALVVGVRKALTVHTVRVTLDRFLTALPLIGPLRVRLAVARFARTLGLLLAQGVPILDALMISRPVLAHSTLEDIVTRAHTKVREGESLAAGLIDQAPFPGLVGSMVAMGERTGKLPDLLLKLAEIYDRELALSLQKLMSLLAPLLLLGMGIVVLIIVLAILLPIFEMSGMVAQ